MKRLKTKIKNIFNQIINFFRILKKISEYKEPEKKEVKHKIDILEDLMKDGAITNYYLQKNYLVIKKKDSQDFAVIVEIPLKDLIITGLGKINFKY